VSNAIPYGKQNISPADIKATLTALQSPYLTQGPAIEEFERAVMLKTGAKHAIAVANGTVALHLAYQAAGIGRGDEVIMPANTFVATSNAALYLGAKPVFADIEPNYANLDTERLEEYLTPRTRAVVAVHFAGHPVDMNPLFRFARKHKLIVIEDAAHALGARYRGVPIGGLTSDAATFSFHPVKSITTGEGGMVVTPKASIAKRLRLLRSHGVTKDKRGRNVMTELGYNYRITDIQSSLGTSQLRRLDSFISRRHEVVRWYQTELADLDQISLPSEARWARSAWHLYVIRVREARNRDSLVAYLKHRNIGVNFHYPPVYWHPYYRSHGYRRTRLPQTDAYGKTCITLPLHTLLTRAEVKFVSDSIKNFFSRSTR